MTLVGSTNGVSSGRESARLKAGEGREARLRGGGRAPRKSGRVRLLPGENPGEFRERMTGLFDSLRPRNQLKSRWLNALSWSNGGSIGSSARSGLGFT